MSTITSAASALARRLVVPVAAGAAILAPTFGVVATLDAPVAAARANHGAIYGPTPNNRYWSITGSRLGAPTEGEISTFRTATAST